MFGSPLQHPAAKREERQVLCSLCGDRGYTIDKKYLISKYFRDGGSGVTAGDLYAHGVPCTCRAGIEFLKEKLQWDAPMPKGLVGFPPLPEF